MPQLSDTRAVSRSTLPPTAVQPNKVRFDQTTRRNRSSLRNLQSQPNNPQSGSLSEPLPGGTSPGSPSQHDPMSIFQRLRRLWHTPESLPAALPTPPPERLPPAPPPPPEPPPRAHPPRSPMIPIDRRHADLVRAWQTFKHSSPASTPADFLRHLETQNAQLRSTAARLEDRLHQISKNLRRLP